jgi:hypothetical protein
VDVVVVEDEHRTVNDCRQQAHILWKGFRRSVVIVETSARLGKTIRKDWTLHVSNIKITARYGGEINSMSPLLCLMMFDDATSTRCENTL